MIVKLKSMKLKYKSKFLNYVENDSELKEWIYNKTKQFLDLSLIERIYYILNEIDNLILCKTCGSKTKFHGLSKGYSIYCSKKCANTNLEKKKYTPKTKEEIDKITEKRKSTNIEKYGVDIVSKLDIFKEKMKSSCFKKYGVDHNLKSKEIQNKIESTNIEKYGVNRPLQNKEIYNKLKNTNLKNFNVENPFQNDEIIKKIQQKRINTIKSKNFKKIKDCLLKYKNIILNDNYDEFLIKDSYSFTCTLCDTSFNSNIWHWRFIRPSCHCRDWSSSYEYEIREFLKEYNIINNDRKTIHPYELDIVLKDYNIAIEFNGLYWHSEIYKDKNYHLNKTLLCEEKEIQLIQIFESEWINKKEIVQSIILSKLGKFNERIFGRKCKIRELSNGEYREFLENNHIQGYTPAKYKIGLFYENQLVSLMSFGQSRFKKDEVELIRYCNLLNTQVVGGFSKLLKFAVKKYQFEEIISYCDLRYFNGSGYIKNGFQIIEKTKPNYWYWNKLDPLTLHNRINFQKHKLKDLLEYFDETLTEFDNMFNNGFTKVWDCGNLKLIYLNK